MKWPGAKQERVARRKEEGGGLCRRSCVCVFGSGNSGHEWGLAIRSGWEGGYPSSILAVRSQRGRSRRARLAFPVARSPRGGRDFPARGSG